MYNFDNVDCAWEPIQKIDIDKANKVATEVVEFQGYLTQTQAIMCLGGASFDEVIDNDIRIWKPKNIENIDWLYPI